jgi:hypothetical protein
MKVISALCLFLFPFAVTSAAPVPYSGKVAINGVNFQGDAQFTFALRDANGAVHWRNADANGSINVPVDRGNYIIFLGGQGMNPFPNNLFLDHLELYLQVRFYQADTQEWFHMLPDQRITSAPHALAAEVANLANVAKAVEPGAITKSMLAAEVLADLNATVVIPQQDTSIQTGSITRDMLSSGVRSDLNRSIVITRDMLPADVLADLNQTVDNAGIASNANIAFSKLAINKSDIIGLGIPAADTDTNLSEAAVDSMVANNGFLTAGSITRQMLPADVLADLNATIPRSRLAADVLSDLDAGIPTDSVTLAMLAPQVRSDLNATISRSRLAGDVRADLNATITRSRLAADVLADLDHSIGSGSITRDMLASDVRTDLNASVASGSVTRDMLASDVRADLNASLSSASVTAANIHPDLVKYFLPEIANHPAGVSALQGTGTTLSSGATGKFLTYQWQKNGVDLSGETNATLVLSAANAAHDGNYTVVVSNDWGSVTSNVSTFTVATNSPVITLVGASSVTHEAATSYTDAGATAVDALDGNLTASIVVAGHDFDNTAIGDHNVTYNVSDAGGNAAAPKVRTVTVGDTTVPVITLIGDSNMSHGINTAWNDPGANASDTLDGNLSSQVAVSGTVDVNATGANVLTYNVSDAAGNAATPVTRTVNVIPVGPWNFTNAAATGRTGPTQAQVNAAYAGGSLEGKITIATQGIQKWTVPAAGTYTIEVWGSSTPGQNYENHVPDHGLGARMKGDFSLVSGDILQILVGQKPAQSEFNGGGGGTFVAKGASHANAIALIVAGGGGSHRSGYGASGFEGLLDGVTGTAGVTTQYPGGTNGGGGGSHPASRSGAGGAGFSGNGLFPSYTGYSAAYSFRNGGVGGDFDYSIGKRHEGGFGGGGAGGYGGSGGGGGYSGGGAGNNSAGISAQGGGGGSYNAGTNQDSTAGANEGHGKVTITFVTN